MEEDGDKIFKLIFIPIHLQKLHLTLIQASGEEEYNPHVACPSLQSNQDSSGQSPPLLLTIQDRTKGTPLETASSNAANFAIQPLTQSLV